MFSIKINSENSSSILRLSFGFAQDDGSVNS